jgi:hypothetical protein
MRCRSSSDRVVEILLLFFISYIKKAVSQIGNVVITIKPYVMKNYLVRMITNGHYLIISSDLNYKVGDFMAVVHNVVSVVQVGIQIRDGFYARNLAFSCRLSAVYGLRGQPHLQAQSQGNRTL